MEQERKRRQEEAKINGERKDQASTIGFIAGIELRVYFPCYIFHAWNFMWFFAFVAWGFLGVIVFFMLAFPFLDSHGVMRLLLV